MATNKLISHRKTRVIRQTSGAAGRHHGRPTGGRSFLCPPGQVPLAKTRSSSWIWMGLMFVSSPILAQMAAPGHDTGRHESGISTVRMNNASPNISHGWCVSVPGRYRTSALSGPQKGLYEAKNEVLDEWSAIRKLTRNGLRGS